jgi:subfamily B ATP-binding cassette protein MsbA
MIVAAGMTALFAKLIQPVMDDVLTRAGQDAGAQDLIVPMGAAIFGCFLVRGLATYGQTLQMTRIGQWMIRDIQNDLFRHLVRLDLTFFHQNPSGQLTSRVVSDVQVMRMAMTDSLSGIGSAGLTLILLCAVMVYQDWQLALIAFAVLPLASFMVAMLGRRLRAISKSIQDRTALLVDRLAEIFAGIRHVQAYGTEEAESKHAAGAIENVRKLSVKAVQVGEMLTPINEVLVGLAVFAIIVYGGFKIADGGTTAGALMSFIAAFALAYEPIKKLGKLNNILQMGLGAAERVFTLMDMQATVRDQPSARPLVLDGPPTITLEGVSFQYLQGDEPALRSVSAMFPAGRVTALVGPSGGGKTTLLNLLLRFYDPTSGVVAINGQDVRGVTLASLRGQMALVSQDISLFNATVRDNIAYGSPDADDQAIEAAARAAAAHEFIMGLPQGYQTVVGESGVMLSGGQRQRLAIARAIVRDAPILLLDEATSALDNESEKLIQESLRRLEAGRTTIVIAHRLSTVRDAHQIIVMDDGQPIEQGTHASLLAAEGLYARLYGQMSEGENRAA